MAGCRKGIVKIFSKSDGVVWNKIYKKGGQKNYISNRLKYALYL
jgi:hypothetical protein